MRACLDDLVIALYVTIDELLGPDRRAGHPGRRPRLADSELVALAVAQVLLGCHGEHRWLRFCHWRLGHLFPYLPNQPGYNKRRRGARWLLWEVMAHLAGRTPSTDDPLRLLDATALPCAASRQTVERSALRGGPTTAGVPATRAGMGAQAVCGHDLGRRPGGLVPGQPQAG